MRGTAAGTDLWVTFEILEHGELGEYDHVCACVGGWGSNTNDFYVPNTVDTPHAHERTIYTVGHSLFLNILSSWFSWTPQTLGFPSTLKEASLHPLPRFQMLEQPGLNLGPFSFLYRHFSLDELIHSRGLNDINNLPLQFLSLYQSPLLSSRLSCPTVYLAPPLVHLISLSNFKCLKTKLNSQPPPLTKSLGHFLVFPNSVSGTTIHSVIKARHLGVLWDSSLFFIFILNPTN